MDRFNSPLAGRLAGNNSFGKIVNETGKAFGQYLGRPSATAGKYAPRVNNNASAGAPRFGGLNSSANRGMSWSARDAASKAPFRVASDIQSAAYRFGSANQGQTAGGSTPSAGGAGWENVNRWDTQIAAAAAKSGVPPNLIKAVMKLESGGDPNVGSPQGASGLMQIMPFWNGTAGYQISDPVQNIMLGAHILKENYNQYGSWEMAAKAYLGLGGADAYGTTSSSYWARVSQYMNELGGIGGTQGSGLKGGLPANGQSSAGIGTIWAGTGATPNLDYGFLAPNSLGLYAYGTRYGTDGRGHTGIDAPMPIGTPNYSPVSGTVVCSCTGSGGGCSAFNDYLGQGCGRIEVALDNGDRLILGHMSTSNVQIGSRVGVGTQLGTSGGMNGPHTHIEYRVPDASQESGYRMVDPAQYLGGAAASGIPSTGTSYAPPTSNSTGASWETKFVNGYGVGSRSISGWRG